MEQNGINKTQSVVLHIIKKLHGNIGHFRIVKLCHLTDFYAVRWTGNQITDVNYFVYYYGPFSHQIPDTINELEEMGYISENTNTTDSFYYHNYNLINNKEVVGSTDIEKFIIDGIIAHCGHLPRKQLQDIVYDSEPFKKAKATKIHKAPLDFTPYSMDLANEYGFDLQTSLESLQDI